MITSFTNLATIIRVSIYRLYAAKLMSYNISKRIRSYLILFPFLLVSACAGEFESTRHNKDYIRELEVEINNVSSTNYGQLILKYDLLQLVDKDSHDNCIISPLYYSLTAVPHIDGDYVSYVNDLKSRITAKAGRSDDLLHIVVSNAQSRLRKLREILKLHPLKPKNPFVIKSQRMPEYSVFAVLDAREDEGDFSLTTDALEELEFIDKFAAAMPVLPPMKKYIVTSPFGLRKDPIKRKMTKHNGIDLRASSHSFVLSAAKGKVKFAGHARGYGKAVYIIHGDGFSTRYAHLSEIYVSKNEIVDIGQVIGIQGNTGRSTKEHLHYEVRYKGFPVDPQAFLQLGGKCNY